MADVAIVYFNPEVIKHKKLNPITKEEVKKSFQNSKLVVYTDQLGLLDYIKSIDLSNKNLLLMSSGNFSGMDIISYAKSLLNN